MLLLLLLTAASARAQLNPTLYHIKDLPLNSQLNPSFQPRNGSLYVGFPGLTSFSPSLMLSGENLTLGNAYLSPRYKSIVTGAGDFGALTFDYEHSFLNVGFMVKDMYFSFDSKLKLNVDGRIPKDLMRLAWYGNGADETLGKALSLEGLGVSAIGYGEISLGVSKEVIENLFVGAKVKYLQGLVNLQAGLGEGSYFKTDSGSYKIEIELTPEIFLAGIPVTVPKGVFQVSEMTSAGLGAYSFDAGNMGVAFDLGGSWDLPWVKGLNVSASVLDIGFINWKGDKVAPTKDVVELSFDGISLSNGTDFATALLDSVKQKTEVASSAASERRWLSPTVYVGANYELAKYLNAGALFGYRFSQREGAPLAALSVNTQGFMVNASASYSYYNRHSNVGVGLLIGRKGAQWHIIADNLLAANYKAAQNVNLRMGVNFLFGNGRAKRSAPQAGGDALVEGYMPVTGNTPVAGDTLAGRQGADSSALAPANAVVGAPDTAASPRRRQAVQDSTKKSKPAASQAKKLSREELLKRAMQEEMAAGEAVKKKPKSKTPAAAKKTGKSELLERALREEAEDKNVKPKKKGKK
ncbi:MAG: DUF5723 family protein [Prevotellaceae bacterium]|nr:DUF5723 family protein [Prevotellaceae bacterium]